MSTKMVTLKGTWSRTNTTRQEVYTYRSLVRERVQRNGGEFDAHLSHKERDETLMSGKFKVTIPIGYYYGADRCSVAQAKHLFRALLARETCRAPKFKVTDYDIYWDGPLIVGMIR